MARLARLMRLALAVFAVLVSPAALAATEWRDPVWTYGGTEYSSAEAACRAHTQFGPSGAYTFDHWGKTGGTLPTVQGFCYGDNKNQAGTEIISVSTQNSGCPVGNPPWIGDTTAGKCKRVVTECPPGTVLDPATGNCVAPCVLKAGKDSGDSQWPAGANDSGPYYICKGGCVSKQTPDFWWENPKDQWFGRGPGRYTGQSCSPDQGNNGGTPETPRPEGTPPTQPGPPQCGKGQCPGTVNGTSVCVPCNTAPDTTTRNTDTQNSSQSGSGGTTSTSTSRDTKCDGQNCTTTTTTTTTTTDSQGNPTGSPQTTTTTTTQSQSAYCTANPTSQQCGGTGTRPGSGVGEGDGEEEEEDPSEWGGSCIASFTCSGDAIQCAMAREQHVRNCQLIDTDTALSTLGRNAANGQQPSDHPANNSSTSTYSLASMLDASPLFGGTGGCPADVSLEYQGHSLTLPFSRACSALQTLGNIWVGLAYLAAFVIVFRRG